MKGVVDSEDTIDVVVTVPEGQATADDELTVFVLIGARPACYLGSERSGIPVGISYPQVGLLVGGLDRVLDEVVASKAVGEHISQFVCRLAVEGHQNALHIGVGLHVVVEVLLDVFGAEDALVDSGKQSIERVCLIFDVAESFVELVCRLLHLLTYGVSAGQTCTGMKDAYGNPEEAEGNDGQGDSTFHTISRGVPQPCRIGAR